MNSIRICYLEDMENIGKHDFQNGRVADLCRIIVVVRKDCVAQGQLQYFPTIVHDAYLHGGDFFGSEEKDNPGNFPG